MAKAKTAQSVTPAKAAEELTRQFFDGVRKLQSSLHRPLENAFRTLSSTPEDVQGKARAESFGLVNSYVEAAKTAFGQSDATVRIEQAQRDYVIGLQRIEEDAQKDTAKAVLDWANTVREVPRDFQAGLETAYAQYAEDLRRTVLQAEGEALRPEVMLALGQSMILVAIYARAGLGK